MKQFESSKMDTAGAVKALRRLHECREDKAIDRLNEIISIQITDGLPIAESEERTLANYGIFRNADACARKAIYGDIKCAVLESITKLGSASMKAIAREVWKDVDSARSRPKTIADLDMALLSQYNACVSAVQKLVKSGQIVVVGGGVYAVPELLPTDHD